MPFCHSRCGVIWSMLAGPLLGLLHAFLSLNYSDPVVLSLGSHSCYFGLSWPISLLLGFLGPSHPFGHPRPILLPWAYAKSFRLPQPKLSYPLLLGFMGFPSTPYSLNLLLRAFLAHSCLLFISYNAHEFTTSFLWAPLGPLAFFKAHLLFSRLVIHYSCHSGLMVFFPIY